MNDIKEYVTDYVVKKRGFAKEVSIMETTRLSRTTNLIEVSFPVVKEFKIVIILAKEVFYKLFEETVEKEWRNRHTLCLYYISREKKVGDFEKYDEEWVRIFIDAVNNGNAIYVDMWNALQCVSPVREIAHVVNLSRLCESMRLKEGEVFDEKRDGVFKMLKKKLQSKEEEWYESHMKYFAIVASFKSDLIRKYLEHSSRIILCHISTILTYPGIPEHDKWTRIAHYLRSRDPSFRTILYKAFTEAIMLRITLFGRWLPQDLVGVMVCEYVCEMILSLTHRDVK